MAANAKTILRLEALGQRRTRLHVDRSYPGQILGVSLITTGPAAGHGFDVDRQTVEQVTGFANGLKGRWTHGDLSADGLGRHLGKWKNVTSESFWLCRGCQIETGTPRCPACQAESSLEWRSVGDFAFDKSAYRVRPDGLDVPAPTYLMDRAEEDPSSLGISVVARFEFAEEPAFEDEEPGRLARIEGQGDLLRGDWVADPAANPIGLHAGTRSPSELTEGATAVLDRIVGRVGKEHAKTRALAFLARYFGDAFEEAAPAEANRHVDEPEASGARVDALHEELAALRQTVSAYRQAEVIGRQEKRRALLLRLKTEASELNAPIPAADLAQVEALLDAGNFDTARVLGEAFLDRSRAQEQVPFRRSGTRALAEAGRDRDPQRASVVAQERVLKRRGWKTEVSGDGTEIAARPPRTGEST